MTPPWPALSQSITVCLPPPLSSQIPVHVKCHHRRYAGADIATRMIASDAIARLNVDEGTMHPTSAFPSFPVPKPLIHVFQSNPCPPEMPSPTPPHPVAHPIPLSPARMAPTHISPTSVPLRPHTTHRRSLGGGLANQGNHPLSCLTNVCLLTRQ
jgi:hypothetical protein